MTEVYKYLNRFSPNIMNDVLTVLKHGYNTQHYNLFVTDRSKIEKYGQNSTHYRANQIWSLLPREIKILQTSILLNQKLSNGVA